MMSASDPPRARASDSSALDQGEAVPRTISDHAANERRGDRSSGSSPSTGLDGSPAPLLQGSSQLGSMNAFGKLLDGYQILVVGEVPAATVRHFADTIQYVPDTSEAAKP